jgi:hypothetical protein
LAKIRRLAGFGRKGSVKVWNAESGIINYEYELIKSLGFEDFGFEISG